MGGLASAARGIVGGLASAARGPAVARQLGFNAGRIASYAIAGAAAGALGSLGSRAGPLVEVQVALFVLANVLLLMLGLYVGGWGRGVLALERAGAVVWRQVEPFARRTLPIDSTAKSVAAGLAWGWVPCGLVYTMLALALASASAGGGALVMIAFELGTLPTLLAAGMAAQRVLAIRRVPWVRHAAGIAMVALAVVGLARVPGLSEALAAGWRLCAG